MAYKCILMSPEMQNIHLAKVAKVFDKLKKV